jgi:hypothetical protein
VSDLPVYGCSYAGKLIPEVIDALNGDGPKPAAVTVGGTVIYFAEPGPGLIAHEEMHVTQSARYAPWWARWMPRRARAWLGAPKFFPAYVKQHTEKGYAKNEFEEEAREAQRKVTG